VPHTINTAEVGALANLYVRKLLNLKPGFAEPYFVGRLGYQMAKFFGNYLSKDLVVNYSRNSKTGQRSWIKEKFKLIIQLTIILTVGIIYIALLIFKGM